jgi:hypothetical protein
MNFVYWLSKYSRNTHERRAVYHSLAARVSGGLGAVQLVIRLEGSFTFIHSANAWRQTNVAYRGRKETSIKKQERKQASKKAWRALVKGTRGRQKRKRETSQLCEQAIPCTAFGAEGTRRNGTELDRYHLPWRHLYNGITHVITAATPLLGGTNEGN